MTADSEAVAGIVQDIKEIADAKQCYRRDCNEPLAGCTEGTVLVGRVARVILLPLCRRHLEEAGVALA